MKEFSVRIHFTENIINICKYCLNEDYRKTLKSGNL